MSARDNRSPELDRQERILELARNAYRASQPSEDEVDRGARRIQRRLRARSAPRPMRRPLVAIAFAVAFGGALAYAATGGRHWFEHKKPATELHDGESDTTAPKSGVGAPAPAENPGEAARGEAAKAEAPKADEPKTEAPKAEAPTPSPATLPASPVQAPASTGAVSGGARNAAGAGAASSWRAVDQALMARDDARAERALNGLATSGDPTTRAKAELGLAQLAQARGDCAEARRHALAAKAVTGADPAVLRRAETLAQLCR